MLCKCVIPFSVTCLCSRPPTPPHPRPLLAPPTEAVIISHLPNFFPFSHTCQFFHLTFLPSLLSSSLFLSLHLRAIFPLNHSPFIWFMVSTQGRGRVNKECRDHQRRITWEDWHLLGFGRERGVERGCRDGREMDSVMDMEKCGLRNPDFVFFKVRLECLHGINRLSSKMKLGCPQAVTN